VGAMGCCEAVEVLPFGELLPEIDIAVIVEQLIELLLIRAVGSLHFVIELG